MRLFVSLGFFCFDLIGRNWCKGCSSSASVASFSGCTRDRPEAGWKLVRAWSKNLVEQQGPRCERPLNAVASSIPTCWLRQRIRHTTGGARQAIHLRILALRTHAFSPYQHFLEHSRPSVDTFTALPHYMSLGVSLSSSCQQARPLGRALQAAAITGAQSQ